MAGDDLDLAVDVGVRLGHAVQVVLAHAEQQVIRRDAAKVELEINFGNIISIQNLFNSFLAVLQCILAPKGLMVSGTFAPAHKVTFKI
jgi:hypothetical protein